MRSIIRFSAVEAEFNNQAFFARLEPLLCGYLDGKPVQIDARATLALFMAQRSQAIRQQNQRAAVFGINGGKVLEKRLSMPFCRLCCSKA